MDGKKLHFFSNSRIYICLIGITNTNSPAPQSKNFIITVVQARLDLQPTDFQLAKPDHLCYITYWLQELKTDDYNMGFVNL